MAEHVMATYASSKAATVAAASAEDVDPLEDLRAGWQTQIEFGLTNPAVFRLLTDPDRVVRSPAALAGKRVLESRVHRIALAGRLGVGGPTTSAVTLRAAVDQLDMLSDSERRLLAEWLDRAIDAL